VAERSVTSAPVAADLASADLTARNGNGNGAAPTRGWPASCKSRPPRWVTTPSDLKAARARAGDCAGRTASE